MAQNWPVCRLLAINGDIPRHFRNDDDDDAKYIEEKPIIAVVI